MHGFSTRGKRTVKVIEGLLNSVHKLAHHQKFFFLKFSLSDNDYQSINKRDQTLQ